MEGIHSTQSNTSIASARSQTVAGGKGAGLGATPGSVTRHVRKAGPRYHESKQIRVLHGLGLALDLVLAVTLFSLILSGGFQSQVQLDGFFIVAMIAVFHVLLHIPLLIAVFRKWESGSGLFVSTGLPFAIASTAVFVYMIVDEATHCKSDFDMDMYQTRCFVPSILMFTLVAVQGILWHVFNRHYNNLTHVTKLPAAHTTQNVSLNITDTTGGTTGLKAVTQNKSIDVPTINSRRKDGATLSSVIRPAKSLKSVKSVASKQTKSAKSSPTKGKKSARTEKTAVIAAGVSGSPTKKK